MELIYNLNIAITRLQFSFFMLNKKEKYMQFFVCLIVHTQNSLYVIQLQTGGRVFCPRKVYDKFYRKRADWGSKVLVPMFWYFC